MLKLYIKKLIERENLTIEESYLAAQIILKELNVVQTSAFLTLLTAKGESGNEIVGFVKALKEHSLSLKISKPVMDIVGTGGDLAYTFNISTCSALLASACGITIVKHGNRAVSSKCGTADVLEELGYSINLEPDELIKTIEQSNFGFCFAPNYHKLMGKIRSIRCQLPFSTIFNLLGPLLNPANPEHLLLGVYDTNKVKLVAEALFTLGTKCSLVFHGNGLDELTCLGPIQAVLVKPSGLEDFLIDPVKLGLKVCILNHLQGDDVVYNANMIRETLSGKNTPLTDTIILNVAAALLVYGRVDRLSDGVNIARNRLKQGNILKLSRLNEIILRKQRHIRKRKSLKEAILNKAKNAVISEIKRASPSAGQIATITNPAIKAVEYVKFGAAAISVLTDEGFAGSFKDLESVSEALKDCSVPVLCKDIVVYPEQIAEAAKAGADAILIMVSVLKHKTAEMVKIVHAFGLEALVEVHSADEVLIALNSGCDLIGVNQRDLTDFSMHPEVFSQLITQIPENLVKIAESGIKTADDAKHAYFLGYDAVLVGEALSRLDSPREFFDNLET